MQISRLFEIVYVLLRRKSITANELAERFGVSQRTIYRDIDTLSLSGIPVYTVKGKGGGISLLPDFVLSKSILSEQEQDEILSALKGLTKVTAADTGHVLEKLSAIFNRSATDWLAVDFSDWNEGGGRYFYDFKTAILERRITTFDYYSTFGEKTSRRIEPMQLWFKSKAWYIKGFCLTRQDIRLFRLTRVTNLAVTDELFSARDLLAIQPAPINPDRIMNEIELTIKIEAEMAYRIYDEFCDENVAPQPDGSYIVSVTWPEDEWLYGMLMSYGEHIEVLAPDHVRESMKDKLLRSAKKYFS